MNFEKNYSDNKEGRYLSDYISIPDVIEPLLIRYFHKVILRQIYNEFEFCFAP